MDKKIISAEEIREGINGYGCSYFIGRVSSVVESALLAGEQDIPIDKLLKAFEDAKEFAQREGVG